MVQDSAIDPRTIGCHTSQKVLDPYHEIQATSERLFDHRKYVLD